MSQNGNLPDTTASPYESPPRPVATEIVAAKQNPPELRVWTALTVPLIGLVASFIVGTVVFAAAIFLFVGRPEVNRMSETIERIIDHPLGIWVMVLPGQLTFLAAAVVAAILSPIPIRKRLRLEKGRLPLWTWILFLIATPCVGLATGWVTEALEIEPNEHFKMLEGIMIAHSALAFLVCAFLVAVVPGVCEEILFRGYVQGRLLKRWSPLAAILVSSILFAVAHVDPLHICAVFPTGIWLGLIAYRAESIWPTILCHFANNLLALTASNLGLETLGFGHAELLILIPCSIAMLGSLYFLFSDYRSKRNDEAVLR